MAVDVAGLRELAQAMRAEGVTRVSVGDVELVLGPAPLAIEDPPETPAEAERRRVAQKELDEELLYLSAGS